VTTPVLLYDGDCGFCDRAVKFAMRHDPSGALRFAALQGDYAAGILVRHPELRGVDSLIWVESNGAGERVWMRSDGALRLGEYLGGVWGIASRVGAVLPRSLRDAAYDAFARRRYRWFGRADQCALPTPEERQRFL
jgi:predicted DCC family thiol-disulfide oxidoreductase YuxK